MVDSLAVSRGWSIGALVGHVVTHPAPDFRPRRDVDIFMDREHKRKGKVICESIKYLVYFLEVDEKLHGDPKRN